jgi:hypothetical protein
MTLETAESSRWAGKVVEPGHEFDDRRVVVSQRHVEWSGQVNIEIEAVDRAGAITYGYGTLADRPGPVAPIL